MSEELFLYDDFFSDPSARGTQVQVDHRGKTLEFRIKKSLTLAEKQAATEAAVEFSIDKNGTPRIGKMDQAEYTKAILLAGLKYWPFEYAPGKPVPINGETIARLDATLAEKVSLLILGQQEKQEEALGPFGKK